MVPSVEDQDARLEDAKAATDRTYRLVQQASQQGMSTEAHIESMKKVRNDNHLAELIRNYAFRTR